MGRVRCCEWCGAEAFMAWAVAKKLICGDCREALERAREQLGHPVKAIDDPAVVAQVSAERAKRGSAS